MEAGNRTLTIFGFQEKHRQCECIDLCIAIFLDHISANRSLHCCEHDCFCQLPVQAIAFCLRAHEITIVMILSNPHRFHCLHAVPSIQNAWTLDKLSSSTKPVKQMGWWYRYLPSFVEESGFGNIQTLTAIRSSSLRHLFQILLRTSTLMSNSSWTACTIRSTIS